MSDTPDTRKIAVFKKCPDCGFGNMKIFTDGTFHCGKCLSGGMISCATHRYFLEDKEIQGKVTNKYVFKTFLCAKCRAIITELPCEWCKKIKGIT